MTARDEADAGRAVLLGGAANALSAARTLARAGVEVHAIGGPDCPVRHSRAVAAYVELEFGEACIESWLAWLLDARLGAVLIPCADDGLELLARHRRELEAVGYALPELDDELALLLLDKERTYAKARAVGVAAPRTVVPSARMPIEEAAAELGLPCALKPRRSLAVMPEGYAGKGFVVQSREELASVYAGLAAGGADPIVTEIVPGPDANLRQYWSYRTPDGELLLELTKRKLRQQPPHFGTGCCEAIEWDEDVARAGRRFAHAFGLVGFSSVEFKVRPSDGELVLIECNYRLIGSNELGRVAGVDAARLVYARAMGATARPAPRPRDGLQFWYPVRDVRAARHYIRDGELTIGAYARSLARRQVLPYFDRRDPLPSAMIPVERLRQRLSARRVPT